MKKTISAALILFAASIAAANAQKFALIDMEYIMLNIPAYNDANEQIEEASAQWQDEIGKLADEARIMYESYQAEVSNMTEEQKTQREKAIITKEKEVAELRNKYFGPEGEIYNLRESLILPIEDEIYEVVKEIALQEGYTVVTDRASAMSIIFASPDIDISDEVLARMGYLD